MRCLLLLTCVLWRVSAQCSTSSTVTSYSPAAYATNGPPSAMLDADLATYWSPTGVGPYWIVLDLGAVVCANSVTFNPIGDTTHDPTTLNIYYDNVGSWVLKASLTAQRGASLPQVLSFSSQCSRNWKIGFSTVNAGTPPQLYEISLCPRTTFNSIPISGVAQNGKDIHYYSTESSFDVPHYPDPGWDTFAGVITNEWTGPARIRMSPIVHSDCTAEMGIPVNTITDFYVVWDSGATGNFRSVMCSVTLKADDGLDNVLYGPNGTPASVIGLANVGYFSATTLNVHFFGGGGGSMTDPIIVSFGVKNTVGTVSGFSITATSCSGLA